MDECLEAGFCPSLSARHGSPQPDAIVIAIHEDVEGAHDQRRETLDPSRGAGGPHRAPADPLRDGKSGLYAFGKADTGGQRLYRRMMPAWPSIILPV